jgi:hypothetical protein
MGSDLGEIDYQGDRPRPGDVVMVIGNRARKFAETGAAVPSMRMPTFTDDCRCKCRNVQGQVFWVNAISNTAMILVIDDDGTLQQVIKDAQMFKAAGIAVDSAAPYNLYVLDDRTRSGEPDHRRDPRHADGRQEHLLPAHLRPLGRTVCVVFNGGDGRSWSPGRAVLH